MINYQEARKEFKELISKHKGIKVAYESGSVSVPGLSDLDFILILDKKWGVDDTQSYYDSLSRISLNLQTAIGPGNILLIPSYLESEMLVIDDFNLKLLSSSASNVEPKKYYDKYTEICRVLDWLPERINIQ